MDLKLLPYAGIFILILFLIIFELKDRQEVNIGYLYYTINNEKLRIRQQMGNRYRVYVFGDSCPIQTKKDRYGFYFSIKATSASEAEQRIDELYGK